MNRTFRASWITAALVLGLGTFAGADPYTLEILPTKHYVDLQLTDVSAAGRVITGYGYNPMANYRIEALMWSEGRLVSLNPATYDYSIATAVSADGRYQIGVGQRDFPSENQDGLRWNSAANSVEIWNDPLVQTNVLTGVSHNGSSSVGYAYGYQGNYWGIRLWRSQHNVLAHIMTNRITIGNAISGDGRVSVGYMANPQSLERIALKWASSNFLNPQVLHPANATAFRSECLDVSEDGNVIAGKILFNESGNAIEKGAVWFGNHTEPTVLLPPEANSSKSLAVSNNGNFVLVSGSVSFTTLPFIYDVRLGSLTRVNFALPQNYFLFTSECLDDFGNVYGIAHGDSTVPAILRRNASVRVVKAEMISRDTFEVVVETYLKDGAGTMELDFTLNGVAFHESRPATASDRAVFRYKLPLFNVPRFTTEQEFDVTARIISSKHGESTGSKRVFVPLPLVCVEGIQLTSLYAGDDEPFEDRLEERGYKDDDSPNHLYPTLYGTTYFPDDEPLAQNAPDLDSQVSAALSQTYAAKVDVVAHSKGGLVARQWIKDFPSAKNKLRTLVMACSPHTGAAASYLSHNFMSWRAAVYRELFPTWPWWRTGQSSPFEHYGASNGALIGLNNSFSLSGVDFVLMYGSGQETYASFTQSPDASFGIGDGDGYILSFLWDIALPFGVLAWSAQGYNVTCMPDGTLIRGALIPAFQAQPPREVIGTNHGHGGYLFQNADRIFELLNGE